VKIEKHNYMMKQLGHQVYFNSLYCWCTKTQHQLVTLT